MGTLTKFEIPNLVDKHGKTLEDKFHECPQGMGIQGASHQISKSHPLLSLRKGLSTLTVHSS